MGNLVKLLVFCLLAALVLACAKEEPASEEIKEEPAAEETTKEETAKEEPAEVKAPDSPAAALKEVGKALEAGMAAEGDTPCEQAYNGLKAIVDSLPKGGEGDKKLPEKEKFLEVCKELPETMQKCMTMSYAMEHAQECAKAKKEISPELEAKLKEISMK